VRFVTYTFQSAEVVSCVWDTSKGDLAGYGACRISEEKEDLSSNPDDGPPETWGSRAKSSLLGWVITVATANDHR
jgi:hypothetical protein